MEMNRLVKHSFDGHLYLYSVATLLVLRMP
jgi:hypothetical protein